MLLVLQKSKTGEEVKGQLFIAHFVCIVKESVDMFKLCDIFFNFPRLWKASSETLRKDNLERAEHSTGNNKALSIILQS